MRVRKLEVVRQIIERWKNFGQKHSGLKQFLIFGLVSNGITLCQLLLMPFFKYIFEMTDLVNINFQIGKIGHNFDGSVYYIFDYAAGTIKDGGGGGLAYFLAVQVTMAVAQVANFIIQRKITFKSKCNIWKAAVWYVAAYLIITVGAAAAQGFYKRPVYRLFIEVLNMGKTGEMMADFVTMLINCLISFWVFYPILKIIFKKE